ncbi:hypothetical protein ASPFODRAFT_536790 [Aspergillus luchuensis CBS 106.47]|uniref:Uncharacterized protein n=1 Tax=Aspergillus luchuensis (strain CBS 106.47) TaxID=1137211 RepID=A0A1M3TNJ0_ASPLC|nr:hypothetical protein ASPFODRAFT_536790 [Aspergillus luchuensis CBS 106.47]
MNSKHAKINLNVTACPVFSAARPARAKCGPKPDRSKLKLQFSSQPLQLNSATNSPPPPPPLSDANLPRSLGDRHFLLPLRYQLYCALPPPPVPSAPFMLLRPSQHSCLYPGVNWSF